MISDKHIDALQSWKPHPPTPSLLSSYIPFFYWTESVYERYSSYIPNYVHPNLISICGFLCTVYSYVISLRIHPPHLFGTVAMIVLTTLYDSLSRIEVAYTKRNDSHTAVCELMRTVLKLTSATFLILSLCNVWGYTHHNGIISTLFWWNVVCLSKNLNVYLETTRGFMLTNYVGRFEITILYNMSLVLSLFRNYVPDLLFRTYTYTSSVLCMNACMYLCIRTILVLIFNTYVHEKTEYVNTMFAISLSYIIRGFGAVSFTMIPETESVSSSAYAIGYFAEGLMLSIPTFEIVVCAMTKKTFNPLIIVCMMASLVDNFLSVIIAVAYYCYTFYGLSYVLNIPLFRVKVRVYCSGVFDMCHRGHMRLFQRAVALGDELVVGVHNDADVAGYKRKPTLCQEERYETVSVCKYVSEVICNAPLYITEEYLQKHRIDIVVCSSEYDTPDDKYYAVPRQKGILRVLPRTNGVSSSDILCIVMSRVQ